MFLNLLPLLVWRMKLLHVGLFFSNLHYRRQGCNVYMFPSNATVLESLVYSLAAMVILLNPKYVQ